MTKIKCQEAYNQLSSQPMKVAERYAALIKSFQEIYESVAETADARMSLKNSSKASL